MAWNAWKVVGGSKLLLFPMVGLAVGGASIGYASYAVSRSWTGRALGVDFDRAGGVCQVVSSVGGVTAAGAFLAVRLTNYRPLPFREILQRMENELVTNSAPTSKVTHAVSSDGTVIRSARNTVRTPPPAPSGSFQSWLQLVRQRSNLLMRAARIPIRFHAINVLAGAAVAGAATSMSQRVACGRTGTANEAGKSLMRRSASGWQSMLNPPPPTLTSSTPSSSAPKPKPAANAPSRSSSTKAPSTAVTLEVVADDHSAKRNKQ